MFDVIFCRQDVLCAMTGYTVCSLAPKCFIYLFFLVWLQKLLKQRHQYHDRKDNPLCIPFIQTMVSRGMEIMFRLCRENNILLEKEECTGKSY